MIINGVDRVLLSELGIDSTQANLTVTAEMGDDEVYFNIINTSKVKEVLHDLFISEIIDNIKYNNIEYDISIMNKIDIDKDINTEAYISYCCGNQKVTITLWLEYNVGDDIKEWLYDDKQMIKCYDVELEEADKDCLLQSMAYCMDDVACSRYLDNIIEEIEAMYVTQV